MRRTTKAVAVFLLLASFVLAALVGCTGGDGGQEGNVEADRIIKINDGYVVIRPENATDAEKSAALAVRNALIDVGYKTNMSGDGEESSEYEILVGNTNRPESAEAAEKLGEAVWSISAIGSKVVVVGKSDQALAKAADRLADMITEGKGLEMEEHTVITGDADEAAEFVEFSWSDGTKRVIRGGAWGTRVYTMSDGNLISGYETSSGIKTMISTNNGKSWKSEAQASFRNDKSCANVNLYEFEGSVYLAYRATGEVSGGYYTSLQVSVSEDFGKSWKHHSTVCEYTQKDGAFRGVWEPFLGELNGELTCFYANDSTSVTTMQNIESLTWNGSKWTDRTIISNGQKHDSRDGMPVWTALSEGGYACVIESSKDRAKGHPFVIQILYSADGVKWGEPVTIYTPTTYGSKAGAPGIVELPSGQIVVSFQTDEDATVKGDGTSVMKTIISDGTAVKKLKAKNFTESDNVFGTPDGEGSVWTGIWYGNGYLYAAAGTRNGAEVNIIEIK